MSCTVSMLRTRPADHFSLCWRKHFQNLTYNLAWQTLIHCDAKRCISIDMLPPSTLKHHEHHTNGTHTKQTHHHHRHHLVDIILHNAPRGCMCVCVTIKENIIGYCVQMRVRTLIISLFLY